MAQEIRMTPEQEAKLNDLADLIIALPLARKLSVYKHITENNLKAAGDVLDGRVAEIPVWWKNGPYLTRRDSLPESHREHPINYILRELQLNPADFGYTRQCCPNCGHNLTCEVPLKFDNYNENSRR